jgi:hypothetical protein
MNSSYVSAHLAKNTTNFICGYFFKKKTAHCNKKQWDANVLREDVFNTLTI